MYVVSNSPTNKHAPRYTNTRCYTLDQINNAEENAFILVLVCPNSLSSTIRMRSLVGNEAQAVGPASSRGPLAREVLTDSDNIKVADSYALEDQGLASGTGEPSD